jgi:hypothetical protein
MNHTKRSPDFLMRVRRLKEKLIAGTLDADERIEIAKILEDNTTDSGCVVRAAEDEPIFTLRAKDPMAANAASQWIWCSEDNDLHSDKIDDAKQCLSEMRQYRERLVRSKRQADAHLGHRGLE